MNWETYKFRCSSLGKLMVKPKKKSETLSQTTKSYLNELFIEETFGRTKDNSNRYTEKGKYVEEASLSLATKQLKVFYKKNPEELSNFEIKGTPDVIHKKYVLDIKSSWDIYTFFKADGNNKDYFYQLQGYMHLTGRKYAKLCYCLVDAPEHMIVSEKIKRSYRDGLSDGTEEMAAMEAEVEKNMTFGDIPEEKRIKVFDFKYDPEVIEELIYKINEARIYLSKLTF